MSTIINKMISDSAVSTAKIASGAVTTAKIADGSVGTVAIAASAVSTAKIASGAVTAAKVADSAIGAVALASSAVQTAKVASGAITAAKIADSAVGAIAIASSAVQNAKIASGAVTAAKIADGAVGNIAIATGIDAAKLGDGSVSNTEFQYLNGVTSGLQTQLDAKADEGSPVFTGAIDGSASTNVDLATTNTASTVDIGTGTGANTINIGGANSTVNIIGSVNNQNVTNMNVTDKLITINDGGAAASGGSSGIEVEENGTATAYVQTSSDRNSWKLKAPNTNGIATLTPGASDTAVVLDTATQTLTNKTLTSPSLTTPSTDIVTLDGQASAPANPSAGFYKMYVDDTTQKLSLLDSAGTVTTVGSGSGVGINYIDKPDAEINATTGWSTYADAAGTSPVDGTGGSPNTTWTASSSSPLRDNYSFLLTKSSGASRQGEGVSYAFTIDAADKGKVLQISFDYSVVSGTFADDALSVWIYDVTNATVIQPAPYLIKNHSLAAEKWAGEFQTSSSSTSYRLILHIGVSTDSSNVLKFDNFIVGPQAKLYGSPVTDWVSFTPTGTWVANTTYTGRWRRVGDEMEISAHIALSGAPTGTFTLNLPTGYSIDTSKLPGGGSTGVDVFGYANGGDSGSGTHVGLVAYNSTTAIYIFGDDGVGSWNATVPFTWGNPDFINIQFKVPILGWSSSVVMSSDADTRALVCRYETNGGGSLNHNQEYFLDFEDKTFDTHGAVSGTGSGPVTTTNTGWKFIAPIGGYYRVSACITIALTNTWVDNEQLWVAIAKNGTIISYLDYNPYGAGTTIYKTVTGSDVISLVAGDRIEIKALQGSGGTLTLHNDGALNYVTIEKISGPAQIAASETVAARYSTNAAQSISHNTITIVDFEDRTFDTHGSVTTGASWKFTAQRTGVYEVMSSILFDATAGWASGENVQFHIYKNAALYSVKFFSFQAANSDYAPGFICDMVQLNAGDYIDIRVLQVNGGSVSLYNSGNYNWVSIISR